MMLSAHSACSSLPAQETRADVSVNWGLSGLEKGLEWIFVDYNGLEWISGSTGVGMNYKRIEMDFYGLEWIGVDLRVIWGWNGLQKDWNGFLWIRMDWSGSLGQLELEWIRKGLE